MKEIKNKKHEHTKELEEISTKDKVLLFTKLNGNWMFFNLTISLSRIRKTVNLIKLIQIILMIQANE